MSVMNGYKSSRVTSADKDADLHASLTRFVTRRLGKGKLVRLVDVVEFALKKAGRRRVARVVTRMRVDGTLTVTADGVVVSATAGVPVTYFDEIALFDWVHTRDDKYRKLHAAVGLHPYFDDDTAGFASTLCGRSGWLAVPGVFSRMSTPRCKRCCRLAGIPAGDGSPKNDRRVRRMFGLPDAGY